MDLDIGDKPLITTAFNDNRETQLFDFWVFLIVTRSGIGFKDFFSFIYISLHFELIDNQVTLTVKMSW